MQFRKPPLTETTTINAPPSSPCPGKRKPVRRIKWKDHCAGTSLKKGIALMGKNASLPMELRSSAATSTRMHTRPNHATPFWENLTALMALAAIFPIHNSLKILTNTKKAPKCWNHTEKSSTVEKQFSAADCTPFSSETILLNIDYVFL